MDTQTTPALTILLVGSGGREHALAWKLSQSPRVKHIYVVPGNAGTEGLGKSVSNIRDVAADNYPGLVRLSEQLGVGLVVVGPDQAVVDGIGDYFTELGIPCFAPSELAAEIEGSKVFAKGFMNRYGIPTADWAAFNDYSLASRYLEGLNHRVVIKVDGLAAGKGVVLPADQAEARQALKEIMVDGKFGEAGDCVVIEEYLEGNEISVLTFSDGRTTKTLPPGQDHKRAFEGNRGPNTGGMGVYAPVPFVSPADMEEIERLIVQPTIRGLENEERHFTGLLFTGVMMTDSGPKVLEYNARFGDPETQALILLLSNTDLVEVLLACTNESLENVDLHVSPGFACTITVAAGPNVHIFHAGTANVDGQLVVAGGRVFSVSATGTTLDDAVSAAYSGVQAISFDDMFHRKDIAARYPTLLTSL
ncbi:putative bifunctional purine Ade1 [Hypoxylon rubiginosum]|uniref:Bifunctional purine Ade1 n=1 Tax=Hypoxylon rubiginosum TaxID=110542 RepID=A0ACC0CIH6_9PEZI|nr:putative bifunctional purine Ade1 [Hypoxylon rubiginosum]